MNALHQQWKEPALFVARRGATWRRLWAAALQWTVALAWAVAVSWVAALGSFAAQAAELSWSRPFEIMAMDKPLPELLRELAGSQGTTAVIDSKVSGPAVNGRFSGPARRVLDELCTAYGLIWSFDGALLHIDPASEARSEVIAIANGDAKKVVDTLGRMQIADRRFPVRAGPNGDSVFVSGPKRYVEMIRKAIAADGDRVVDRSEIRMFPLKYARAGDFRIARYGRDLSVPGVAQMLRRLFARGGQGPGSSLGLQMPKITPRTVELHDGRSMEVPKIEFGSLANLEGTRASASENDAALPRFEAEERMNAVLVRDLPERMPQYERLIAKLDVRPRLVELELTIMDVSSENFDELGIEWRAHGRHLDVQTGRGNAPPLTFLGATTEAGQTGAATPLGAVLTGSIGGSARAFLLARVRALATSGQANLLSRPKVLTFDNTEAILENLSELHVRVQGFQDASLFRIISGTSVRITPQLFDAESATPGLMLAIDIQDGDLSAQVIDGVPIVRRRTITTQAMVKAERSLLIAGYSSEEKVKATSAVPGLSSLPVIGRLFRSDEQSQVNLERLYLLTPRLVTLETDALPQQSSSPSPPTAQAAALPQTAAAVAPAAANRHPIDIVADSSSGVGAQMVSDLARWVAPAAALDLRSMQSLGPLEDLYRLSEGGDTRLALAQYDSLQALQGQALAGDARAKRTVEQLRTIVPLHTEEIVFVARADAPLQFVHELRDKTVNLGPASSSGHLTAAAVYRVMFETPIAPERATAFDHAAALQLLREGGIDAVALIGAGPASPLARLDEANRRSLKLLVVDRNHPASRRAAKAYLPATVGANAFGGNWPARDVPVLAVMSFLVAAAGDASATSRIAGLVRGLCSEQATLVSRGHPKWREVQLMHLGLVATAGPGGARAAPQDQRVCVDAESAPLT